MCSNTNTLTLPWGCLIPVDPQTHWPLNTTIEHHETTCKCCSMGGKEAIIRKYLFICVHEFYYKVSPERYDSLVCMEMVREQAERLGLELDTLDIWDAYPDVLPPRPKRRVSQ